MQSDERSLVPAVGGARNFETKCTCSILRGSFSLYNDHGFLIDGDSNWCTNSCSSVTFNSPSWISSFVTWVYIHRCSGWGIHVDIDHRIGSVAVIWYWNIPNASLIVSLVCCSGLHRERSWSNLLKLACRSEWGTYTCTSTNVSCDARPVSWPER